ncbi:hypothetical protein EYF80_031715 [Liparis tanakae]|uniref:Uncharacterized protein n=1 Tax=Liparis tanakae TaxID=230148 RepID=A0A4Z2GZ37_9TELE|nr:hypothetical protein EYF80_031715 [Liparis tanakae]
MDGWKRKGQEQTEHGLSHGGCGQGCQEKIVDERMEGRETDWSEKKKGSRKHERYERDSLAVRLQYRSDLLIQCPLTQA